MSVLGWLKRPTFLALAVLGGGSAATCGQWSTPGDRASANGQPAPAHSSGWRPSGGWQPASQPPAEAQATADVQTAYFQAQGSLSDGLPAFPGAALASGAAGMPSAAVAPPSFPSQPLPAQPRSSQGAAAAVSPPALPPAGLNAYSASGGLPPPGLPPPSQYSAAGATVAGASGGIPAQLASGELRAIQNERLGNQSSPPAARSSAPGSLAATSAAPPTSLPSAANTSGDPRLDAQRITSGYPFVTPPPRGRYATSPYQPAVFQASFPAPSLARPVSAQLASTTAAPPPAASGAVIPPVNSPTAGLPQFAYAQPGIYPTGYQCTTPVPSFPSTGAVPGAAIPPTLPPNLTPNLYTPNNAGYVPLFSLGQENYNVQLGRGIIGQPTVYVPGQPIRNFMRYLSP